MSTIKYQIPFGVAIGNFLKLKQLTRQEWRYNIDARRAQLFQKVFNRTSLVAIDRLDLPSGWCGEHELHVDNPRYENWSHDCDSMQVMEIVRVDTQPLTGDDFKAKIKIYALNRRDGEWIVVTIGYKQQHDGYKKANTVAVRVLDTDNVIDECSGHHSACDIWIAMEDVFKAHCEQMRKRMEESEEIARSFASERAVHNAHATKLALPGS